MNILEIVCTRGYLIGVVDARVTAALLGAFEGQCTCQLVMASLGLAHRFRDLTAGEVHLGQLGRQLLRAPCLVRASMVIPLQSGTHMGIFELGDMTAHDSDVDMGGSSSLGPQSTWQRKGLVGLQA